jgi:hypothetical protein
MFESRKGPVGSFQKIGAIALLISLVGTGAAFAARPVFPVPPRFIPPPPPCISAGPIYEFPPGCYSCQVRNVSANNRTATIDIRNEENQTEQTTPLTYLAAGRSIITGFCSAGFQYISCVVTTPDGTIDSLSDLAVIEQYSPGAPSEAGGFSILPLPRRRRLAPYSIVASLRPVLSAASLDKIRSLAGDAPA